MDENFWRRLVSEACRSPSNSGLEWTLQHIQRILILGDDESLFLSDARRRAASLIGWKARLLPEDDDGEIGIDGDHETSTAVTNSSSSLMLNSFLDSIMKEVRGLCAPDLI